MNPPVGFHAVVLAAGAGSRFGGKKLLATYRGAPLIESAVATALAAPVETVTVVTGADHEAVEAAIRVFSERLDCAAWLRIVQAADHAEGMGASLRAGVAALPADAAGVLVVLGDMPAIPAAVPPRLIAALTQGAPAAVPVFEGRRGHPAAFARALFPELLASAGDRGARDLLKRLGAAVAEIETTDAGVVADVDTPEDLARLG